MQPTEFGPPAALHHWEESTGPRHIFTMAAVRGLLILSLFSMQIMAPDWVLTCFPSETSHKYGSAIHRTAGCPKKWKSLQAAAYCELSQRMAGVGHIVYSIFLRYPGAGGPASTQLHV